MRNSPHMRGAIAGLIGAVTLAVWFLVLDMTRGAPLQTPAFLAGTLLGSDGVAAIAIYTVIHVVLWVAVGVFAAWVLDRINAAPHFLFGAVLGVLLFNIAFYSGVLIGGENIVRALGWPAVLAGNLVAGVALLGWLQFTAPAGTPMWSASFTHHPVLREGVIAGLIGATIVAAWFFVLDLAQGRLLHTPAALGSALLLGVSDSASVQTTIDVIAAFTIIHVAGFIGLGIVASAIAARAEEDARVLLGAALLLVTLETFVIGVIAAAATWLLDIIPWWSFATANVLAAVAMGGYLWRAHPALHGKLSRDLEDEPVALVH